MTDKKKIVNNKKQLKTNTLYINYWFTKEIRDKYSNIFIKDVKNLLEQAKKCDCMNRALYYKTTIKLIDDHNKIEIVLYKVPTNNIQIRRYFKRIFTEIILEKDLYSASFSKMSRRKNN